VVHATLLDEGRYVCSARTMYRMPAADGNCREWRNQRLVQWSRIIVQTASGVNAPRH